MRIYLTQNNFTLCIPFPTRLFLNRPVIKIANWACKEYCPDVPYMDPEDIEKLYQAIRSSKKNCKKILGEKWYLVDARSASGQRVRIML